MNCSVQHLMIPINKVPVISPKQTIRVLKRRLHEKGNANCALVTETGKSDGKLVGIISLINIIGASDDNLIDEWMTAHQVDRKDGQLAVALPTTTKEKAIALMRDKGCRQLPVVDDYDNFKPLGIVTLAIAIHGCENGKSHKRTKKTGQ